MPTEKPLVNKKYQLEKFPGKGGWTYVVIEEIPKDKRARFGWVKVKGFIDDFEIQQYKLMPMGNHKLFLPVRAEIRKKIKKQEGDWVNVVFYADHSALEIPEELLACLEEDPIAHKTFLSYTEGQQKEFIDWIASAKTDKTKVERMAATLDKLVKGEKFRD